MLEKNSTSFEPALEECYDPIAKRDVEANSQIKIVITVRLDLKKFKFVSLLAFFDFENTSSNGTTRGS